ncbi:MAG: site-2 protease family protein [Candidatus Taylorbacteria bacterium]|nr:site-2 protease family protein [Candidatus Taylorbacteria bacterium]
MILILSVVAHEVAHGFAALKMGDKTAYYAGRLSLNPVRHLDWFGSVIVPLLLALSPAGFILGWAKPVPINPYNFRHRRLGEIFVSAAGPATNILLAVVFGLLLRFFVVGGAASAALVGIGSTIVVINIVLAVFNLIPVPPLDGSKIVFATLPERFSPWFEFGERYGLIMVFVFAIVLWRLVFPVIPFLFETLTGFPLALR